METPSNERKKKRDRFHRKHVSEGIFSGKTAFPKRLSHARWNCSDEKYIPGALVPKRKGAVIVTLVANDNPSARATGTRLTDATIFPLCRGGICHMLKLE